MQRFYIPQIDLSEKSIKVDDYRVVNQVAKVLRMKVGDSFSVFDENGKEVVVEISDISRKSILCQVLKSAKSKTESGIEIHLYQAIPKKTALFELIVQKATELGVSEIHPIITKRTENQHPGKPDRLNLIAVEATEQCGRTNVPIVRKPVKFEKIAPDLKDSYIAYVSETNKKLTDYLPEIKKSGKANIIIGPEGGFDEKEVKLAKQAKTFTLGPRVLRTETAAIVSLGLLI